MSHKATVFLSCGQRAGERQLAEQIETMIKDELQLDCYNADSRQGFDDTMSITENLARADYYVFIDFKRSEEVPVSVFAHQEFALARAWQITEMLAFIEEGLKPTGMLSYVLAHPEPFQRSQLVNLVRSKIRERKWSADYCRNLLATTLRCTPEPVFFGDHHGQNLEKIWCIRIENRRKDRAALNTIAILQSVTNLSDGTVTRPDQTSLKWAGQDGFQRTIFPVDSAELDAFAIRVGEAGVFLHSSTDQRPRKPIIAQSGRYRLAYVAYADSFPVSRFEVTLDYKGHFDASTSTTISDPGNSATLG